MADLGGFAALVQALDLVISVDNTTVHKAGALDVPVWVLLPLAHDWRWLLQRDDNPWYPSVRLWPAQSLGNDALREQLSKAGTELARQFRDTSPASPGKLRFAAQRHISQAALGFFVHFIGNTRTTARAAWSGDVGADQRYPGCCSGCCQW